MLKKITNQLHGQVLDACYGNKSLFKYLIKLVKENIEFDQNNNLIKKDKTDIFAMVYNIPIHEAPQNF